MLHNVNLKIVNLNTLTLCLSFCNRMAPPTPHQLTPPSWCGVRWPPSSTGRRGFITSWDLVYYIERMSNEYYLLKLVLINKWKYYVATRRPFICVMFVWYRTCSFIQHRQQLNCFEAVVWLRHCRAVGSGAALTRHVLWRGIDRRGLWHGRTILCANWTQATARQMIMFVL